jgi:hypothetical protein
LEGFPEGFEGIFLLVSAAQTKDTIETAKTVT